MKLWSEIAWNAVGWAHVNLTCHLLSLLHDKAIEGLLLLLQ